MADYALYRLEVVPDGALEAQESLSIMPTVNF
jgi:hypothetical protein